MALRELIANAMDSNDPNWSAYRSGPSFYIENAGTLTASSLLMGFSQKTSEDSIGQFGEGYKVAIAILLSAGYSVSAIQPAENWTFTNEWSETFGANTVNVYIEEKDPSQATSESLIFAIRTNSDTSIEPLSQAFDELLPELCSIADFSTFSIVDTPGLYVKGLFVANPEMEFGYNFHPRHITLNRDRTHVELSEISMVICRTLEAEAQDSFLEKIAPKIYKCLQDARTSDFDALISYSEKFPRLQNALVAYVKKQAGLRHLSDYRTQSSGFYISYGVSSAIRGGATGSKNKELFAETQQDPLYLALRAFLEKNKSKLRRDQKLKLQSILAKCRKQ